MQQKKINTSAFYFGRSRIGIYYLPQGNDLKYAGVIYDCSHSSFLDVRRGMIDWNKAVENVSWLQHV